MRMDPPLLLVRQEGSLSKVVSLSRKAEVSQMSCWRDFVILNVKELSGSLIVMHNRRSKMNQELRFDGLVSFQVLLLGASEQDVIVVVSSIHSISVYNLPNLELVATRAGVRCSVLSVNHALEKIVVYCKKGKVVQILNSKLEKETSWSLRHSVKHLLLLDNGNVFALLSSGVCYVLENRNRVRALDEAVVWVALCRPAQGIDSKKVIHASKKGMGAILIDSRRRVYYGDNRGNVQETPISCDRISDNVFSTHFGALCLPGDRGFDILVQLSRHDIEVSKNGAEYIYKQNYYLEGTNHLVCNGQNSEELLALERTGDDLCHIACFKIDHGAFEQLIECLTRDKMFDTALNLIYCQGHSDSHDYMQKTELGVLHELARNQIYQEKDYRNGMLTLSMCCQENAVNMLMFFEFLLPLSLRQRAMEILFESNTSIFCGAPVEKGQEEEVANALLPYLWSHRNKLLGHSIPKNRGPEHTLLDSAIFNCLLRSDDNGALLQFLQRRDVSVDYEMSRMLLQQSQRYRELIELYKSQGHHSTAMDLLKILSTGSSDQISFPELVGRRGAQEAARYLSTISNPELSLIKFHSRWMMNLDPLAVLDMFLGMHSSISNSTAVSILSHDGTPSSLSYAAQYLEEISAKIEIDPVERYEQHPDDCKFDLIVVYLKLVVSNTPEVSQPALCKLENLLLSLPASCNIDFHYMVSLLPPKSDSTPDVLQARVLLLERLKRHREALEILIFDIGDHARAEKYCKRAAHTSSNKDSVYITLLDIILSHQECDDTMRKGLAIMRQRQSAELAMVTFLRLPGIVNLGTVHQYLKYSICTMKECQKRMTVEKYIIQGRMQGVLIRRARGEQGKLAIQAEKRCSTCQKRLGVSAHVHDGTSVFHYSCFSRTI